MCSWKKLLGQKKPTQKRTTATAALMGDDTAHELIELCEAGLMRCEGCNAELEFAGVEPLSVVACPSCDRELMIPWELGNWWITRPLRPGGFGLIYLGRDRTNPLKKVAVKVLGSEHLENERVLADFMRESEICYALGAHPHLPDTYAVGEEDGRQFIVQEFISGRSFHDYFEPIEHRPDEELGLYYLVDLISALTHIYECGYIHRDIKPENIMLTDEGTLTLLDFGNCMTLEEAETCNSSGLVVGSPQYMPPERYGKAAEDMRSDIYSLGLVAYFMMSGQTFAKGDQVRDLKRSHTKSLRFSKAVNIGSVSDAFNELMSTMIRRNPDERYQDYGELFEDVATLIMQHQKRTTNDRMILARRKHFLDNY
jgi:serine/threonine-protein kinase